MDLLDPVEVQENLDQLDHKENKEQREPWDRKGMLENLVNLADQALRVTKDLLDLPVPLDYQVYLDLKDLPE